MAGFAILPAPAPLVILRFDDDAHSVVVLCHPLIRLTGQDGV